MAASLRLALLNLYLNAKNYIHQLYNMYDLLSLLGSSIEVTHIMQSDFFLLCDHLLALASVVGEDCPSAAAADSTCVRRYS